jgi:predicted nucleic acid-binding protein
VNQKPTQREKQAIADKPDEYVRADIIPARFKNDALHVAVAVWHKLEVVVTWNMAHLVNMRKVERINVVNERSGLPRIRIHTPEEVLDL